MSQSNQQLYEFGEFRLDAQKRTLQRKGEVVPLAPKTFDLLLVLVRDRERHQAIELIAARVREPALPVAR